VRLLLCLCELPFALLKTTAVIPFTVLIDGVNGRAVVQRLEASRTLLVLEIVGKPHTKSPRCFFYSFLRRSYWIPGSYAPALSEKRSSFLRLLKNRGFKEERMTKIKLYAIGTSTTLESNKSLI